MELARELSWAQLRDWWEDLEMEERERLAAMATVIHTAVGTGTGSIKHSALEALVRELLEERRRDPVKLAKDSGIEVEEK